MPMRSSYLIPFLNYVTLRPEEVGKDRDALMHFVDQKRGSSMSSKVKQERKSAAKIVEVYSLQNGKMDRKRCIPGTTSTFSLYEILHIIPNDSKCHKGCTIKHLLLKTRACRTDQNTFASLPHL